MKLKLYVPIVTTVVNPWDPFTESDEEDNPIAPSFSSMVFDKLSDMIKLFVAN